MKQKNKQIIETESIPRLVILNIVPAIIAMLMVLIYNLADTFFIGQTHDPYQIAAVSLATPVFLLVMAIGTVFGVGGTSVISRTLGQGRLEYARKVSAFCMWSCVVMGILFAAAIWIFLDPILTAIGSSVDTVEYAGSYLRIIALSGPFLLIGSCFSNILRAEGQVTKAMLGTMLGNLVNIILDPIFILFCGWDVAGAAIATVFGNIVGAGYYLLYFLQGNSKLSISIKDFQIKNRVCSEVLSIGIPAAIGSILMSVSNIVINSQIAAYGDMAVAGVGVAMKVTMITGMVSMGLGQGIQPLLGFCVGAETWNRYKEIFNFSLMIALAAGIVLVGLCYIFVEPIVRIFLTDASAFDYGVSFAKILLSTNFFFGVFFVMLNALQAMGAAVPSLIINCCRQGLIYIPVLFILAAAMGITGLIWAQPVADVLSMLLVVILYGRTYIRMKKERHHLT